MKTDTLTFESVARLHMTAEPERQQAGLRAWQSVLTGDMQTPPEEAWHSLKEIATKVRKHPVWLWKLGVQRVGVRLGGRFSYKLSDVERFLGSAECAERIAGLRELRKRREQGKKEELSA